MRIALLSLEFFTAATALAGGALFVVRPDGALLGADPALLAGTPFDDWLLPGVLLAGLVGVGFAIVGLWQLRRGWMASQLAIAAGAGLVLFEVVEFAMIGFHPLQALYGLVGVAVIVLAALLAANRHGTILVLPGGGYARHAPHEAEPVARWLRGLGWDARVVRYPVQARHPQPLRFVQREIARERERGVQRVGVLGFSAGGHLAGHVALSGGVDLAILGYPVVSMVTPTHAGSRHNLIGADADDALRRSVSLELLVTDAAPPFFIWSTGEDEAVPVAEHGYRLAAALAEHGVPHDLHVFDRGAHGLGLARGTAAAAWRGLCATWLRERV